MAKLSLSDVEREYLAWERAAVESFDGIDAGGIWILPIRGTLDKIFGTGSDLPDDYGIEYADTERLVHTPWACGFVEREAVVL